MIRPVQRGGVTQMAVSDGDEWPLVKQVCAEYLETERRAYVLHPDCNISLK